MNPALLFLLVLGGIVGVGWVVSKITGSRAFYLEDWRFDDGEKVLWRDDAADAYVIPKLGQARVMSFARLRRSSVVVTDRRIFVAQKPLLGKKHMVMYVLHLAASADGQTEKLGGGLLTVGYQSLVIEGAFSAHLDDKKPYLELLPAAGHASSANLSSLRIYTDEGAGFRMPQLLPTSSDAK